ncbi:MAG: adenylosuccinate synthase [Candidatus Omnitrophica bacterium]|nr:adenylosuccinate synthase [Candidatus Omnitrophota bacterium]
MINTTVVGAQWGDEGKGKIIDTLSGKVHLVVRYQGGNNAGHTVYKGRQKYVMHLVPSGILHAKAKCLIASGVVVDPAELLSEIRGLEDSGIRTRGRLFVSEQCHLIFPFHRIYDRLREEKKGFIKIGTTGRGIGPCYSDRALRSGIRLIDLYDEKLFSERLTMSLKEKNEIFRHLYGFKGFSFKKIYDQYRAYATELRPYMADSVQMIQEAMKRRRSILFEGAQGTMLDLDQGTYPFVTSSSTVSGGATVGAGIPPAAIRDVLGVAKAYTTRVGEGPFPTELPASHMEHMRDLGDEFGATTGRARRCGWFDAVVVRYAAGINGFTRLAITKLDVLDSFKTIRIAVAYRFRGKTLKNFPHSITAQREVVPVYESMPGWSSCTSGIRTFDQLPPNARKYIRRISSLVGVPICLVSVGKGRDQVIRCRV